MGIAQWFCEKILFIFKLMCFNLFQGKKILVNKDFKALYLFFPIVLRLQILGFKS